MPRACIVMPYHISEHPGGAEAQAWLLARELARRGWRVSYLAQSRTGKTGPETRDGVDLEWVAPSRRFPWTNSGRFYRALLRLDPELVVIRNSSHLLGVVGHYCGRHGRAGAWICTDNWSPLRWFELGRQRERVRAYRFGPLRRALAYGNALVGDLMRRHGVRRMRWCLTQNDVQARRLEESFGRASARMVSGHEPPPAGVRREEPLVLWVGNPGMNKRPELFVDVARRCPGVRCVMVGDRRHPQRGEPRELPGNVEHCGRLPFDETLAWFDRAALFVNTSAEEGFPNTFVQAWLRGVPVLTLGVDPDGVIARHGLGEVCVDAAALAARVQTLLADDEARRRLGRNAREYAERHHTVARMADRFLASIGETAGRPAEATA